jgi:hypothetical protein
VRFFLRTEAARNNEPQSCAARAGVGARGGARRGGVRVERSASAEPQRRRCVGSLSGQTRGGSAYTGNMTRASGRQPNGSSHSGRKSRSWRTLGVQYLRQGDRIGTLPCPAVPPLNSIIHTLNSIIGTLRLLVAISTRCRERGMHERALSCTPATRAVWVRRAVRHGRVYHARHNALRRLEVDVEPLPAAPNPRNQIKSNQTTNQIKSTQRLRYSLLAVLKDAV